MSEEFQTHLFEAFSREKNSTVSKTEGTGLGLSIVKKIVSLADGTISVKSVQGGGSTFTVEIPFRVMDEQAIEEFRKEKASVAAHAEPAELKGIKILLAEDNEMNREIAADILEEAGFEVETAEDGRVAVDMFAKNGAGRYDLILMDIQMPMMNGYEATKAIRELPDGKDIPIIALSANAFAEDKAASIRAGMNDHIAKPIKREELFDTIGKFAK